MIKFIFGGSVVIPYEFYKFLHLLSLIIFFSLFFKLINNDFSKKTKLKIQFFLSLLIFSAGMGLMARLGFRHGEAFPGWVKIKIGLLFSLNLLVWFSDHTLFKKLWKSYLLLCFCILAYAVMLAIYKFNFFENGS